MDGEQWRTESRTAKAWTVPGSVGRHLVGVAALKPDHEAVLFSEGGPDLLAAFHCIAAEGREHDSHAVAMLGASMDPMVCHVAALEGKHVRMVTHADEAGRKACNRWLSIILGHGGKLLEFLSPPEPYTDLNDMISAGYPWPVIPETVQNRSAAALTLRR
jgi:hypothetical protein